MSESILSQLQTAVDQLAGQESELTSQLTALQEQRKGLQTVIDMFDSSANSNGAVAAPEKIIEAPTVAAPSPTPKPKAKKTPKKATKPSDKSETKSDSASLKKTASKRGRKPKAQAASSMPTKTARKTRGGKAPNWSRYIQDPFKKTPLPDIVANILKAQPDQAFKIADVMEAIFKDDIPKTTFLKARNRVSNILSAGARTREWSRGRGGRYSLSEKALAR